MGMDAAHLTAPSGWTHVGDYDATEDGITACSLWRAVAGAGLSWATSAGDLLSDFPMVGVIVGYDVALPTTLEVRTHEVQPNTTSAYVGSPGANAGPGTQAHFAYVVANANSSLTYPPQAPSSRNTTKITSTIAGLTAYASTAHLTHADTGFTGEGVWVAPGSSWDACGVSVVIPDPAAITDAYSVPTADQWASLPSATVTTSTSSTITGTTVTPDDSRFRYPGVRSVYNIGSGWYRPQEIVDNDSVDTVPPFAVKFTTDSQTFEVNFRQRNDLPAAAMKAVGIRLKVNGKWTTDHPIYLGNSNTGFPPAITTPTNYNTSTTGWFKVDLGSAATRTIEVWMMTEFAGVKVPTANTITAAPLPKYTAVVIGDSMIVNDQYGTGDLSGGAASTYTAMTGPFAYMAQSLGIDNFVTSATGAGAYSIVGESQKWDDAVYLARDVEAYDPEYVFVGTGFNDFALQDSPNSTTIGNAAADLFSKIAAALPNAQVIVFGSSDPTLFQSAYTGLVATANAVYKAKAQAAGLYFFDPRLGVLYNPSGAAVYSPGASWWQTSWEGPDGAHPTQAGSKALGLAFADVFEQILPAALPPWTIGANPLAGLTIGANPVVQIWTGDTKVFG